MTGSFITVTCDDCNNEQRIFTKASTTIECLVCDTVIAKPTGSTITIQDATVNDEQDE